MPQETPVLWHLEVSHYNEKARWALDYKRVRHVRRAVTPARSEILLGDNLAVLDRFPDGAFQLVYADPPFNTGRRQRRTTLATVADGAPMES